MDSKINVMGIDIDYISLLTLKKKTLEYLTNDRLNIYVFLSTKLVGEAVEDKELETCLKEADFLLPGVEQIFDIQSQPLSKKNMVNGYHSFLELIDKMDKTYTIYVLASQESAVDKITSYCKLNFPKVTIIGTYNQKEDWTDEQLVNAINSANPDMIVNTIPTPVEGKWVATYWQQLNSRLYIGLGAIFDIMVSELKAPPLLIRKLHLLSLYHKIRGFQKHKSCATRIFRRKVEQYNTKKGDNDNGTTY